MGKSVPRARPALSVLLRDQHSARLAPLGQFNRLVDKQAAYLLTRAILPGMVSHISAGSVHSPSDLVPQLARIALQVAL